MLISDSLKVTLVCEHPIDKLILKWTSNKICFSGRWDAVSKVGLTDSFAVLLFSFTQDVPRDYRHVSLTGVKQRFEDETYAQISKEKVLDIYFLGGKVTSGSLNPGVLIMYYAFQKVMDYTELCQILEVPGVEPQVEPPSPTSQPADLQTFLASPSSTNKR